MTKAYDGAVNQQLSGCATLAEISTDVVSNVQLGSVQFDFVLVVLCTGRDWHRVANAPRGWSAKAWRLLFQASSPKNDARLVMMTMVVLAVFVGHERYGGRGWTRNGRQRDLEELTRRCFREFWKERGTRVRVLVLREELTANIRMSQDAEGQSKGSRMVDKGRSKRRFKCECHKCREASAFEANKRGLAETRYVDMTSVDLNALEIAAVLLLERNRAIQIGIDSRTAVIVFASIVAKRGN